MSRRKYRIAALCLGLVTLVGGQSLFASDLKRPEQDELKARMQDEGWTQISDGVYERQRGATKVEHLGYGREGLTWSISELERRRESLIQEYLSYPSEELADVIDELGVTIAKAKLELRNMPREISSMSAAVSGGSCSDICYSATADAYYLTAEQGVGAVADAKFNSQCGYSGDTYAYAYARANLNGTTTTLIQEDPRTGTSATSHAAATMKGSSDCYSEAYASTQSPALGITYSTSDVNSGVCPAPVQPPTVHISGPALVSLTSGSCATKTWTSTVSGGVTPYSYEWYYNNTAVGTGTSYSQSVCYNHADFQLRLVVTGGNGQSGSDLHNVNVNHEVQPPTVTISGPTLVSFTSASCTTETWTSTVSGGATPYSYQWYYKGAAVGTGTSYSRSVCYDHREFRLTLIVTDGNNLSGSDSHDVKVNYNN